MIEPERYYFQGLDDRTKAIEMQTTQEQEAQARAAHYAEGDGANVDEVAGKPGFPDPGSKTLAAILADLRKPVHEKYIKKKDTGRYQAEYIHHATVRDLLDYYAPGWWSEVRIEHAGDKLYVVVALTIVGSDASCRREGIGNESDDLDGYGDPSSNAHAMALRRAAMEFGLGRNLWKK